jgi:flagellar FliL protein
MAEKATVQAQAARVQQQQIQQGSNNQNVQQRGSKRILLFIAIPVVLLQILIAYLLVLDINSKLSEASAVRMNSVQQKQMHQSPLRDESSGGMRSEYKLNESEYSVNHPEFLFVVHDLIVNPAGTGGLRYLLTSVGIEVTNEQAFAEIQSKEVIVNDILINVFSSKTLEELSDVSRRKELRREIAKKINEILDYGRVRNVYFSKFIIQ